MSKYNLDMRRILMQGVKRVEDDDDDEDFIMP